MRITPRRRGFEVGNASVSFLDPSPSRRQHGEMAEVAAQLDALSLGKKSTAASGRKSMRSSFASVDSFRQYLADQRALHGDDTPWDVTMRAEPSFTIAEERVLHVLTDVVPWQPDWENLTVLDISNRRVETIVKLHEFCPSLLDVNL